MRAIAVGVIAGLVLLCAAGVGVASASKRLQLSSKGFGPTPWDPTVLPAGTEAKLSGSFFAETESGEIRCSIEVNGAILSTDKPTDEIALTTPAFAGCGSAGYSVSTGPWNVSVKSSGKVTFTSEDPTDLTEPGPCVYVVSKISGTMELPGFVELGFQDLAGKLNKGASLGSCPKTRLFLYEMFTGANETGSDKGGTLEAEVIR